MKRLLLLSVALVGCQVNVYPVTTQSAAPASTTPRPFLNETYDAGDFEVRVPYGWTQTAKDKVGETDTIRVAYQTDSTPSPASFMMIKSIANENNFSAEETLISLKKSIPKMLSSYELIKEVNYSDKTPIGFYFKGTDTGRDSGVRHFGYQFAFKKDNPVYTLMVLSKEAKTTEDQAIEIANSFKVK